MSKIVKSVLEEELLRLQHFLRSLVSKLKEYPQGYLLKRRIRGKIYYYLSYREGDKIRQKYLGALRENESEKIREQIKKRIVLKDQLMDAKKNVVYLKKLLKK